MAAPGASISASVMSLERLREGFILGASLFEGGDNNGELSSLD